MEPSDAPHAPTLDDVKHSIEEARDAEHSLEAVMPNAIHAHDDDYAGMTGGASPAERARSARATEEREHPVHPGHEPADASE